MPSIQPGPYYPGIDNERAGILPDRVQVIKKDLLDIDVDDNRLDESAMCDVDQIFNTSGAPERNEEDAVKAEKTHFCTPDPNPFTDMPPVELDPSDLNEFDYDFEDSGDAKKRGGDEAKPISAAPKKSMPTFEDRAQRFKEREERERMLTGEERENIQAAKDRIQLGLLDLPPDVRATMLTYLQDIGWKKEDQVLVPRDRYSGPVTKAPTELGPGSGAPKTVCLSASGEYGLREGDMGQVICIIITQEYQTRVIPKNVFIF